MKTLKEHTLFYLEFDRIKHELDEDSTEKSLNKMTRMEFLDLISDGMERLVDELRHEILTVVYKEQE